MTKVTPKNGAGNKSQPIHDLNFENSSVILSQLPPPPPPMPTEGLPFPRINLSEVTDFYENLVSRALALVDKGRMSETLAMIAEAAKIAYLINWRFQDARLEGALERVSASLLPTENCPPSSGERIVFFDSWGMDVRGLSLQYVRALNAVGAKILFICESRNDAGSVGLRDELSSAPETQSLYLNGVTDEIEKARRIHKSISGFGPSRIMMHMNPWAVGAITAFHAFPGVPKYQINLTDHAFWLGTGCTDYSVEFRDYGLMISQNKRGIPAARTILNPYYPIVEDSHIGSVPERGDDDVVIFTGGAFYKMYGREGYFFDLISSLLDDYENVVVWIAGNGRTTLLEQCLRRHLETGRVKLIGNRKDINAVFRATDIYLSTYPFCGALMAQLAAANDVPILSFTSPDLVTNNLEDIVGTDGVPQITFTDVGKFRQAAAELITDVNKRTSAASAAKAAMHNRATFERRMVEILSRTEDRPRTASNLMQIDYNAFTSLYLEIENHFQDELAKRLLRNSTLHSALKFPLLTAKAAIQVASFSLLKRANKA
ncbi:glycosyltransferase family 4 protein [Mesorhizobium australicum]|uniref:Glycosyltransferase n=1 Tax=Mesorhizobium australicum TaxID=536018 RepID=A0A1X7NTC7_9HYPH|nr:glycosyltransferase family 4 protein [Mesorhizobium australicum]SMH40663.1 hypothetical protein SAMN02982922_2392 [Mesorhizobium australicum]